MFLKLYNILWKIALPFLRQNSRLKTGFTKRTSFCHLKKADIWIQAASAGEAYLAVQLARKFSPLKPARILFTTTTSQGMDILINGITESAVHPNLLFQITWFPFDAPKLMQEAVSRIRPALMVLIETEIWPAHLHELKKRGIGIIIINGRLSKKSAQRYILTRPFWKKLGPDKILAISELDAARFKKIFHNTCIETMHNMKFDSVPVVSAENPMAEKLMLKNPMEVIGESSFQHQPQTENRPSENHQPEKCPIRCDHGLGKIIKPEIPLAILASIRMEEEEDALFILMEILKAVPDQIVAVFPRHMHRIKSWEKMLRKNNIKYSLRSRINGFAEKRSVILWDTFGELKKAYAGAASVFVGGSLKPLGGQNFIEPLGFGAATVTGPHVDNFNWVGEDIFENKLVTKADTREEAASFMVDYLKIPPKYIDKKKLIKKAGKYIRQRQGGTKAAIKGIEKLMGL